MSDTAVSVLTPPGTGAIATVEVRGPRAWELAKALFVPAGRPLPEAPEVNRFWFGTLGSDEVVLAVTAPDAVEVHCHGGRRVVRWVVEQFLASGGRKPPVETHDLALCGASRGLTPLARLLEQAPTLRTAGILLDQLSGAFATEVRRSLALLETAPASVAVQLYRLATLGNTVGRHLVEPWKVAIAGPPNVGKSSLINALAGYQRAVVSEVAGTTRDALSVRVAFDGWPVELIDTAGLREAEGLEAEGIEHAKRVLDEADVVVWLMESCVPKPIEPPETIPPARLIGCVTKSDLPSRWGTAGQEFPLVSATTGDVGGLVHALLCRIAPIAPAAGGAVPYTPQLIAHIQSASRAAQSDRLAAERHLRAALAYAEDAV